MTGFVILNDGSRVMLPVLTGWKLIHTDGTSSDSFSVGFCWEAAWEGTLKRAVRFEAWEGTEQRFYGIVDEYEVNWSENGLTGELFGRGLAGLLMDNEAGEQVYNWVRLGDILRNYALPYQLPAVEYAENYWLTSYAVDYGTNCWSALSGFCLWAAGIQPRFLADGTLVISPEAGGRHSLLEEQVQKLTWRQTRYGVYSRVVAKYVGTYYEDQVDNDQFRGLGGSAVHRMTIPRKNRCRAGLCTPWQALRDSEKGFRVLEVTLAELFWAEPADVVTVNMPKAGIYGTFQVVEAENGVDQNGRRCKLRMREMN